MRAYAHEPLYPAVVSEGERWAGLEHASGVAAASETCMGADLQDEKEYYDDLQMELELSDAKTIMYKIGEAFFDLPLPSARKQLRADLKRYDGEISDLKERCEECEHGMKDLKVQL